MAEYKEVFFDDFNGEQLDRSVWNVELHEPGWVNKELQEYVDSPDNIYIKDSMLYLVPIKHADGSITSGRVSTQDKKTFIYGKFEARAKVPRGKGYLPAFWLMANDENEFGQWPVCGEIDIMEVLGDVTNKNHGTLHYGNPHDQNQGSYTITEGPDFADDFHVFTCEWEPGKISWSVDGNLFYETSEWFSKHDVTGENPYPAPFDHEFYIILNLAVGGEWVGYPDEDAPVDQPYIIDYVKVWQKLN